MATNVTCSRCSRTYLAYSSQSTVAYRIRQGRPLYCPDCRPIAQRESLKRNNQERYRPDAAKSFVAPCRMTIVPARESSLARCRPGREGRCPLEHYDVCLDFAARNGWDGWRIAE